MSLIVFLSRSVCSVSRSGIVNVFQEVHDQKVQLDNLQHVKYTLAQQLEEARRRLEDAERVSLLVQSAKFRGGNIGFLPLTHFWTLKKHKRAKIKER